MASEPPDTTRMAAILELVLRIGEGDLSARGALSAAQDDLDGVVAGLNMLAEELEAERAARKLAEGLLRDELDAYEQAPALFASLEAESLTVLKCNATLAAAVDLPKDAIVARSIFELHTPECRPALRAALEAIASGHSAHETDFELLRAGRPPLLVQMSASLVQESDGQARRIRVVWRDVTEQKALEGQLIQAQKLQGIGQLAGGIAHDFNNLLTVILSTVSLASAGLPRGSQLADDLAQIGAAAEHGAELTHGLLAFSRKSLVKPKATTWRAVVESAQKLLHRLIPETILIEITHSADPWEVLVDAVQFGQIVVNLAINASDSMPSGGTLTIETANVVLDDVYAASHLNVAPGEYAMLCVSDTGVGMPKEVRERAFEPFFTTKPPGKGTGLGLAICYGIVQQARGSIWLYSEPGRGTTVKVYVPRLRGAKEVAEAEATPAPAVGGTETILVAEDDARVRSLTVRILRGAGYRVLEATNGRHALDLAAAHRGKIELVVTDVMMPEMGGRPLVDALRERGIVARALFVSGYTENSIVHQGVLEDDIEFLPKPFGPLTLLERVRVLLSRPLKA